MPRRDPGPKLDDVRRLVSFLRAEKLRGALGETLAHPGHGKPKLLAPLRFLDDDGTVDLERLSAMLAEIDRVRADAAVLDFAPIDALPPEGDERRDLVRRVAERAVANAPRGASLTERELGAALGVLVTDVAYVRRLAVDYGILERSGDGAEYRLAE